MRLVVLLVILVLASFRGVARAADYVVELAPQSDREAAQRVLDGSGIQEARVVRRYVRGTGWAWLVVVEDLHGLSAARDVATRLATPDQPATILERDGRESRQVEVIAAARVWEADVHPDDEPGPKKRRSSDAAAAEVLARAVRAHGGRGAGLALLSEASAVRFVYDRVVAVEGGTLTARNRYHRRAASLRLEVDITEGQGQDSVSVLSDSGEAWVEVGDQAVGREADRVREVLHRFAPEEILAVPLGLPEDVETAVAWRDLHVVGVAQEDGVPRVVLAPKGQAAGGLVSASFNIQDHTLGRVTWSAESGELTFRYDDYRRLDRHLIVPFHTRIERDGQLVEDVRILELELDVELDDALFAGPPGSG